MTESLEARQRAHVFYTWTAQSEATPVSIASGQGATFTDHAGKRWLDFEAQVFNCNAGHGERRIIEAMQQQVEELACAHPAAVFETKARLGELLASVTPGDLNHFLLCLSGAEANENALKIARMVTGRSKVIARRRSYHGASMGALSLTGDPRRHHAEPGLWGVIRAEDPYCHRCPFGLEYPACKVRCASHVEHVIQSEGPDRVAAVFLEGITGANGGLVPPDEYWPMVREICDRYGILLVSDEVFTGFGRTGAWFAVDHYGVVPDMITMAKGVTSGYAPLGVVAVNGGIAGYFEHKTLWCGLTNHAHPVSCASAAAAIEVYRDDKLIERAAALEPRMLAGLRAIQSRYPIVTDVRGKGLFGVLELDRPSAPLKPALHAAGLHTLVRDNCVFVTPPLVITGAELDEGLAIIEAAIAEVFS